MVTFKITFNIQICYGQDTQMSVSNNAYFLPSILEPLFSFILVALLCVTSHVWL